MLYTGYITHIIIKREIFERRNNSSNRNYMATVDHLHYLVKTVLKDHLISWDLAKIK